MTYKLNKQLKGVVSVFETTGQENPAGATCDAARHRSGTRRNRNEETGRGTYKTGVSEPACGSGRDEKLRKRSDHSRQSEMLEFVGFTTRKVFHCQF
jgi:hypothetical protein